jgi:hypothetical protein
VSFGGTSKGLLNDTKLVDLEVAWRERVNEATALSSAGYQSMALALRFYALEIRLKSIVCKRLNLSLLPGACKTHDLSELIIFTGLLSDVNADIGILESWNLLKEFSKKDLNELRYVPGSRLDANKVQELIDALDNPTKGVWMWLSRLP